jgi:hypothetical protein
MTTDTLDTGNRAPCPIQDSYEAYGCEVNTISPAELFERYKQADFLYPAKLARLTPFLPEILDNWRRGIDGGESISSVVTYLDRAGAWASVSSWRSTHGGWNSQHLVSTGGPVASRAVLLAAQADRIRVDLDQSHQNWFQPSNRYANRVFGSIVAAIGPQHAAVQAFNYLAVPVPARWPVDEGVRLVQCAASKGSGLFDLAVRTRGRVYAVAEELDHEDLLLDAVDQLYATVGLRRYRRVWLAMINGHDGPVGAAIAQRGPLGFNLSFLESRCDLLVEPTLTTEKATVVTRALVSAAASAYEDFPPGAMPLITDDRTALIVCGLGGELVRQYAQGIWLRAGYLAWYRHVERLYERRFHQEGHHGTTALATVGDYRPRGRR